MPTINVGAHIARPVEEVFAYVTNLRNVPVWDRSCLSMEVEDGGPLRVGARVHDMRSLMGRRLHVITEITAYEPPRAFAWRGERPFPVHGGYRFAPEGPGTRIEFYGEGELRGLLGLLGPLTRRLFTAQMRARFVALKEILEANREAAPQRLEA